MSSSAIEIVIKQALKTFSYSNKDTLKNFNENFSKLVNLVGNISCEDIYFEQHLLTQEVREVKRWRKDRFSNNVKIDVLYINRAPVTYIQIFENDLVTLGVFVIREGNKLPLHNHPLMHGIIRVLAGTLKITSYSVLDPEEHRDKGGGTVGETADSGRNCEDELSKQSATRNAENAWNTSGFSESRHNSEGAQDFESTESRWNLDKYEGHDGPYRFHIPGLGSVPVPCYQDKTDLDSQDSAYQSQEANSHTSATDFCPPNILSYINHSERPILATRHPPLVVSSADGAKHLTPCRRNLHEIRSLNGPAAFLDVIGPPYKPLTLQDCTYFEDMGELSPDNRTTRRLQRIPCPQTFFTDEEKYKGPPIQLDVE